MPAPVLTILPCVCGHGPDRHPAGPKFVDGEQRLVRGRCKDCTWCKGWRAKR